GRAARAASHARSRSRCRSPDRSRSRSSGRPPAQNLKRCPDAEPEIEAERPAARVGDVHVERLLEGGLRPGGYLPEARDPGGDEEADVVVRLAVLRLPPDAKAPGGQRQR